jgi:hypothetical protein
MTDIQLIDNVLNSKKPSDIFQDNWKKTYINYSKILHPDYNSNPKAAEAMSRINQYKDLIENGTVLTDESGDFKVFDKKIVFNITDTNRELIRKSFENFKILKSKKDGTSINFHKYLPESMKINNDLLIVEFKDSSIPLTGLKLPQEHVNWIMSRMMEVSLWFRNLGYSHIGMNPTTVFVVPETHGIIITSFYHMTPLDEKATTISAKYKMWYPTTLFSQKIATPDIDLELCKKIAIYLLGDKSAGGTALKRDKDVNQEMLTFLLTKHQNEFGDYEKYRALLKKNFEKKFYTLDI